jgi:oxygen-dependent protoporphyrinogen oxidase
MNALFAVYDLQVLISCGGAFAQLFSLDLAEQIVLISKNSPAARNRYIYYPDHLVRMPGRKPGGGMLSTILEALRTLFTEPIFKGTIMGILKEPAVEVRSDLRKDESVGDFTSRRFGSNMADNLLSAFFHGVYAGDIYKLSADTILGVHRLIEVQSESVIIGAVDMLQQKKMFIPSDYLLAMCSVVGQRPLGHFDRLRALMRPASVFTIKDGLAEIARGFERGFKKHSDKIQVVTDARINDIRREDNHDITVLRPHPLYYLRKALKYYADIVEEWQRHYIPNLQQSHFHGTTD